MDLVSDIFTAPRQANDLDLLQEVTKLLEKAGHPNPNGWTSDARLQEAQGANPKLQRFLINRYWRLKLGSLGIDTTTQRYCLFDEGPDTSWLQTFDNVIVSTVVTYQLG